jgi:hypothetical protein
MRRSWLISSVAVFLLSFALIALNRVGGAQPVQTPVGQLGGPVSLTPGEQQPTPNPTPSEEATPEGNPLGPEGCTVAPLPLETAIGLLNGSAERQEDSGSAATPSADADAEVISTTFDIFVACVNGGDYLRIAAITSTEFFQEIVTGTGWQRGEIEPKLSSLHPREPDHYLQVLAHGPVLTPADNLATEVVQLLDPASPYFGQFEIGVTYELVNGQWLVGSVSPVG